MATVVGCGDPQTAVSDVAILDPTDGVGSTDSEIADIAAPQDLTADAPDETLDLSEPVDSQPSDTTTTSDVDRDTDAIVPVDVEIATDSTPSADTEVVTDTSGPPPFVVSRRHWRLTFQDDFKGKTGAPSDDYCFDTLKPQCHIWPGGNSHNCDLSASGAAEFLKPWRANVVAALRSINPGENVDALSDPDLRSKYGEVLDARWRAMNKCTWTSYQMLNWMATDYAGHQSARFDPTAVEVDSRGKGYLKLSARQAPVATSCIFGGSGGDPNCQLVGFEAGRLHMGTNYFVDADPRWPGIYYAPPSGGCFAGDTFTGVNCIVVGFEPHFLEATGVAYWVDADPQWPGLYYANRTYRCSDNVYYEPSLGFKALTCPIINGGVMSRRFDNHAYVDADGQTQPRGLMQQHGRFEAKVRIPKGRGAFPAAWLMPESGGWPYDGGEIDVIEARDAADETYQTYHTGKCYNPATGNAIPATDSGDCARLGGTSTHLSKGFTTRQRAADEFWRRDHLFAVEWIVDRFDYYLNATHVGTIEVGTEGQLSPGAPAHLAALTQANFPFRAFYWILNHSTWVAPEFVGAFVEQNFLIDFIRNYDLCDESHAAFCPDGGYFIEGTGCLHDGQTYASPCQPSTGPCINGGELEGGRCRVYSFEPGVIVAGVTYWVDADVQWPGLYYAKVQGQCPHGGEGSVNCMRLSLPADLVETGVEYVIDRGVTPVGLFYRPDFAP